MAEIRCPMCGKWNSTELDECQFCHARLKPLISSTPFTEPPQAPASESEAEETPDWLNALRGKQGMSGSSHKPGDTSEEVPDWLARLREREKTEPTTPDETENALPDWLGTLSAASDSMAPATDDAPSTAEEPPEWLRDLRAQPTSEPESPAPEEGLTWRNHFQEDLPTEPTSPASDETPNWFAQLHAAENTPSDADEALPAESVPSWLNEFGVPAAGEEDTALEAQAEETPDWLRDLAAPAREAPDSPAPAQEWNPTAGMAGELPDWLGDLSTGQAAAEPLFMEHPEAGAAPDAQTTSPETDRSAAGVGEASSASQENASSVPQTEATGGLRNWLGSLDAGETPPSEASEPTAENLPDWLASLHEETPRGTTAVPPLTTQPASTPEEPAAVGPFLAAGLPDWIADLGPVQAQDQSLPPAATEPPGESKAEALAPAELPSWVQAMRPFESAAPAPEPQIHPQEDARVEDSGPLAGLRGALPAEPAAGSYRRPPIYSAKLQVTDVQRRSVQILEDLLASENVPVMPKTESLLSSQQMIRLLLAVVLIAAIVVGTMFPLISVPQANTQTGLNLVVEAIDALPQGAPVLVAVDYEPALVGEMQESAAGVLAHLMSKQARLALISTNPTGPALVDSLLQYLAQPQAGSQFPAYIQAYARDLEGSHIARLGYLAGGTTGLLQFALNPQQAAPGYTADYAKKAWDQAALQGVKTIHDFKAVVILTDNVDTARIWMEQFQPTLKADVPVLMVSSAQAAPVMRAYLDGGQLDGLVTGLAGGSVYNQTLGLSSSAQNWNGFQGGMLATLILIFFGGLLNGLLGRRAPHKTKEKA